MHNSGEAKNLHFNPQFGCKGPTNPIQETLLRCFCCFHLLRLSCQLCLHSFSSLFPKDTGMRPAQSHRSWHEILEDSVCGWMFWCHYHEILKNCLACLLWDGPHKLCNQSWVDSIWYTHTSRSSFRVLLLPSWRENREKTMFNLSGFRL